MRNNKTTNKIIINEYNRHLTLKCAETIVINNPLPKITDDEMYNLTFDNYKIIIKYNYNCEQLKIIAKLNKLKISGNKKQLINRIYSFFYLSYLIVKIQKCFRGKLVRICNKLRGPAVMNRELCTNKIDFLSMDEINTIEYSHFFSYKDEDNFTYGFDIVSLYNLICKSDRRIKNPYNRNDIPNIVVSNLQQLLKIHSILKTKINVELSPIIPFIKNIKHTVIELFQNIDSLGHYSDPNWFLNLSRIKLVEFIIHLTNIWDYRAQIPQETKNNICPPNGDIFRNINISIIHTESNIDIVRKVIVDILCNLVNNGINNDNKSFGCYYVLGALTMVNEYAALSLPWLYQAFRLFN